MALSMGGVCPLAKFQSQTVIKPEVTGSDEASQIKEDTAL